MEFPKKPSKRELERQQAISTVISGMAYKAVEAHIDVDYVPPDDPPPKLPSVEPGFNWETYITYINED